MNTFPDEKTLRRVHEGLQQMPSVPEGVKAVDIRRNKLESIFFAENEEVEYLDASDNKISDISPVKNLKALRILDISYNLVSKIPVLPLDNLEQLYLIANDIKKIQNISFPKLTKLDLASNEIQKIEQIDAPCLSELYLASNIITHVPDIRKFGDLKVLDLQYNLLYSIDCALLPPSLKVLLLQGNKFLRELKNLEMLTGLEILSIKDTKVKEIKSNGSLEIWNNI